MADNQEVMMADYVLPSGEAVIARAAAGCQSGAMPLGQGELMLTETRVLWFGRAGILHLPLSLWRPELELQFHEIGKITSPPLLGAINVRGKQGQLYIFNLQ